MKRKVDTKVAQAVSLLFRRLPNLRKVAVLSSWLALVAIGSAEEPVLLLNDTFNATTANTWDLNTDLGRQTGTVAPISYSMAFGPNACCGHQLQNVNAPNQLLLAGYPASTSSLNYNFNGSSSAGGLKISFDVDPLPTLYHNPDLNHWGCINLGLSAVDQLANIASDAPHFGILFRANGSLQAFDGAAIVNPTPEPVYSTGPRGFHHIDLVLTDTDGNPFDGTGHTFIEVFVDHQALPVFSFVKSGGYANNYLNWQGSSSAHFDNLVIRRLPADRAPTIIHQPQSQTNALGDAFSFTVSAIGPAPLSYQWQRNGINIPGATSSIYVSFVSTLEDGGIYSVLIENAEGVVLSSPAALIFRNVDDFPGSSDSFSGRQELSPNSLHRLSGNNCQASRESREPFHAGKLGGLSVWYQWTPEADGIATFRTRGSTFDTLLAVYTGSAVGALKVVASDDDGGGFATSEVRFNAVAGIHYAVAVDGHGGECGTFLLDWELEPTNETLPVITCHPQSRTVLQGQSYLFSVTAPGAFHFQWFFNGQPVLIGGSDNNLQLPSVQPEHVGFYKVRVIGTNPSRFVDSRTAILEIGPVPEVQSVAKPEDLFSRPEPCGGAFALRSGATLSSFDDAPRIPVPRGGVSRHIWNNLEGSGKFKLCGVAPTQTRWILLSNATDGVLIIYTKGSLNDNQQPIQTVVTVYGQHPVFGLPSGQLICAVTNDSSQTYAVTGLVVAAKTSYWVAADGVRTNGTIQINWVHRPSPLAIEPSNSLTVPVGRSVNLGLNLSWNASPGVPEPESVFAWRRVPSTASLENSSVFKLVNVQAAASGSYSLTVSNIAGMTNIPITLTVDPAFSTLAESTFDSLSAEGWTGSEPDRAVTTASAADFRWGYLVPDTHSTSWRASAKFCGNQSAAYGGWLEFDLTEPQVTVVLRGGGLTLTFQTNLVSSLESDWRHYRIPLVEGDWRLGVSSASWEQLHHALAYLTSWEILLPSNLGLVHSGYLDNVALIGPTTAEKAYLVIRRLTSTQFRLEWPLSASSFTLQQAPGIRPVGEWTDATLSLITNSPYIFVPLLNNVNNRFFRLREPSHPSPRPHCH